MFKHFVITFVALISYNLQAQLIINKIQQKNTVVAQDRIIWQDLDPNFQTNILVFGSGFTSLQAVTTGTIVLDTTKKEPIIQPLGTSQKEKINISVSNDDYIKMSIFKVIDDNTLELTVTFSQYATTGRKTLVLDKRQYDFYVLSPLKMPEIVVPKPLPVIKLNDLATYYFEIANISNYKSIEIERATGVTDKTGYKIIAAQAYPDQSKIAVTISFFSNKYFTEDYRIYVRRKDTVTMVADKNTKLSDLFTIATLPRREFKSKIVYSDNSQPIVLLPSMGITLTPGEYRLKNFNNQNYDLAFRTEQNEKFLISKTPLIYPPNKGYGDVFEIVEIESGNESVRGYFVDIRAYQREEFSSINIYQPNKTKINTLLLSPDTALNKFFMELTVQNYPKDAKPIEERLYFRNNFNERISLKKINTAALDDQKIKYYFELSTPASLRKTEYKLYYLDLNNTEREVGTYEVKQLNSPLPKNSNIISFSYQSKNQTSIVALGPGDTSTIVKDILFRDPQFAILVDLSDNNIANYGDQHIKFEFEVIREDNTIEAKSNYAMTFEAGKKSQLIPLNSIPDMFCTYKPWYSVRITAYLVTSKSFYSEIPLQYSDGQKIMVLKNCKLICEGRYVEPSIGLSFPLQQSIVYYNKKADIDAGQKRLTATPFTLSVDFNINWRDKLVPKEKYRWYMTGLSLLGNTTRLAEADNYYIGLLGFIGGRFQRLRKINPNLVFGFGPAFHLVPATNYSDIVPQFAFRFGFDIVTNN